MSDKRTPDKPERYSISRAIADVLATGSPQNPAEADFHFAALRDNQKSSFARQLGWPGKGFVAPIATRQLETGPWTNEVAVTEGLGVLQWSSVINAGATVLGPLRADLRVWHTSGLPTTEWLPEIGLVTESDPTLASSVLTPYRIAASVIFSRQLFVQASGVRVDEYVTQTIGRALSQSLDAACLYGTGPTNNQPTGVILAGATLVTFGANPLWENLVELRRVCTNNDAPAGTYALISSPNNEASMLVTEAFAGGGVDCWHAEPSPKYFSPEAADDRFFWGLWPYLVVGLFGGTDAAPGLDVVVDPYTGASAGILTVTASLFCDCAVTWPALFSYSEANPLPFTGRPLTPDQRPRKAA